MSPTKRWRVTASGVQTDYSSERGAYDYINSLAATGTAAIGVRITIHHWNKDGARWELWERAVITSNGWESA